MKFFADTADIAEIRELAETGLLDGVTTNPTHISKTGRPIKDVIAEICSIVPGPISAEVAATDLDGMEVVREIRQIYDNYPNLKTQLLAASIRTINNVKDAALAGADVATMPPAVLKGLVKHPLTDKAIEIFVADWKKTGQTIS